ncbi:MAG: serine hydrolase domain-containing protein [Desulfomonilaceae bacterium]
MPFSEARSILQHAHQDNVFTAAVASVWVEDRFVFQEAVGSLGGPGTPHATPRAFFDLASVTKVVATTMAWLLMASDDLSVLDAPLSRWLPSAGEDKRAITPRHLLAHASGLPAWRPYYLLRLPERPKDFVVAKILSEPLEYPIGERTLYSDLGFILLGYILEAAFEQDFATLCQNRLFKPLGLEHDLMFNPNPAHVPTAWTRFDEPLGGLVNDLNCRALRGVAGHAGLFGTADGVTRMCRAFMQSLVSPHGFFAQEAARIFAQRAAIAAGSTRALGFDTPAEVDSSSGRYFSPFSLGHTGFTGVSVWMELERQIVIVLLTNRVIMGEADQRIKRLRPMFHDAVMAELLRF